MNELLLYKMTSIRYDCNSALYVFSFNEELFLFSRKIRPISNQAWDKVFGNSGIFFTLVMLTAVLRLAKRAPANVRRLNNRKWRQSYCSVGERSRAHALLNATPVSFDYQRTADSLSNTTFDDMQNLIKGVILSFRAHFLWTSSTIF